MFPSSCFHPSCQCRPILWRQTAYRMWLFHQAKLFLRELFVELFSLSLPDAGAGCEVDPSAGFVVSCC